MLQNGRQLFGAWHNAAPNPLLRQGLLAFWQVAPMVPIRRGVGPLQVLYPDPVPLDEGYLPLEQWLAQSETNAYLVVQGNRLRLAYYAHGLHPEGQHGLMSISKSITGTLAGRLISQGLIQPQRTVTDYLPQLRDSAYRDVTVEQVWHMTSGVAFDADTRNPHSDVNRLGVAIGWHAPASADDPQTLWAFLQGLNSRSQPPGQRFHYNDADTEVLARVLEQASSQPLVTLLEQHLWEPMGAASDAYICVDAEGLAVASAGISTTPMDLARLCRWLLDSPYPLPTNSGFRQQLWVDADTLAMRGNNGQSVVMLPNADLFTLKLSAIPNDRPGVIAAEHRQAQHAIRAIAQFLRYRG